MIVQYIYFLSISFIITFILMPLGFKIIRQYNFYDTPSLDRKIHTSNVMNAGGVIVFSGVVVTLGIFLYHYPIYAHILLPFLGGLSTIFTMGLVDDKNDLSPNIKLLTQIISSFLFIILAEQYIPFNFVFFDSKIASIFLTVFFMVSVINAFNLIDGLDGLATGLGIISIISLSTIYFSEINYFFFSITGALFAFLRRNSYPAKIFLGDTGSYVLGYCVSTMIILSMNSIHSDLNLNIFYFCLLVGIPIIDIVYTFFRRLISHSALFEGDKKHVHHLLLGYGIEHKNIVFILYILHSLLAIIGLILIGINIDIYFLILIVFLITYQLINIFTPPKFNFKIFFEKLTILNTAYVYFFISLIISLYLLAIINSINVYNENILNLSFLSLFISLLFILDRRTRSNNNIDFSIAFSSCMIIAYTFYNSNIGGDSNWTIFISQYLWYLIIAGLFLSFFGLLKKDNNLFESPSEYLIIFSILILGSIPNIFNEMELSTIRLFILKAIALILVFKIILQDKIIRKYNVIHFMGILAILIILSYNIS